MSYITIQETKGQGMVHNPNCSDEQGGMIMTYGEDDISLSPFSEDIHELKRFPSNENFDNEKAIVEIFGLNKKYAGNRVDHIIPESEQLGLFIEPKVENELERLSFDRDQAIEPFRPKTDQSGVKKFVEIANATENVGLQNSGPELVKDIEEEDKNQLGFDLPDQQSILDSLDSGSQKEIRWRKGDDKKLYAAYRSLCRRSMLNLRDVVFTPLRKNKDNKALIEEVARQVDWKGKTSMLVRRLKKILTDCNLSVREMQDLTRLYKQQVKDNNLNWESIVYEFPGKSLIYIKEV